MERKLILRRLLDKYENSKHLTQPGVSARRVMLRIDKKELPEYQYESSEIRDRFNLAARELEREKLVWLQWVNGRPVIELITLNLEQAERAYGLAGRIHPVQEAEAACTLVREILATVQTLWIRAWRDDICTKTQETLRPPAFYKRGLSYAREFLSALVNYDGLQGGVITVRAFSTLCFQNSKRFEKEFQEDFLRAAAYGLAELEETDGRGENGITEQIGPKEKLAFLGIYTHPELYPLTGRCSILLKAGRVDLSALFPYGAAIPGSVIDDITAFDFRQTEKIILIENLTNYDEYLLAEIKPEELVIYHGGFLSPKKRQLMQKISDALPPETEVCFWADIDLGGFQMFGRLQGIFPRLRPMRMSGDEVRRYADLGLGLARKAPYLRQLRQASEQETFPLFKDAIQEILRCGCTVEQEVFYAQSGALR